MTTSGRPALMTPDLRRAMFAAVVAAQDAGASVAASRTAVGKQFRVAEARVRAVEREGMDRGWPPL